MAMNCAGCTNIPICYSDQYARCINPQIAEQELPESELKGKNDTGKEIQNMIVVQK